jgi:MSHA biogenesis protein MshJ
MKQLWERLAGRIDSRNIRERALLFAALVITIIVLGNVFIFKPLLVQEKRFASQVQQDVKATRTIQSQIEKMAGEIPIDPNAENRDKLAKLKADADAAEEAVHSLQKGLVSPDQIGSILENILNRQGKLRLVSLRKLPLQSLAASMSSPGSNASPSPAPATGGYAASASAGAMPRSAPADSIYKHGVEIVVQGQYLDILEYLASLENIPHQVFWGSARFKVDEYPKATLTVDMFTLSLEKKWLNI